MPSFFQHMLHAEGQHGPDVIVIQGIEHGLPLPPEADKVRRLQNAQLVGHGALGQIQHPGNIAHAQLALKEHIEDLDARRIAKNAKQLRQIVERLVVRQGSKHLRHRVLMHVEVFARRCAVLFRFCHGISSLSFEHMNDCSCVYITTSHLVCQ